MKVFRPLFMNKLFPMIGPPFFKLRGQKHKHGSYYTTTGSCSARHGFTLLEVLVAMTILSLVVAALYTAFKGGTESWTRGRAMSEVTQNARIILEMMSRELGDSTISFYDAQGLLLVGQNSGASDELDFTAMLRSPDSSNKYEFGLVEIGYAHDSTNNKIERRIDVTALWDGAATADTDSLAGGNTDDLAYNVTSLNFEYWDGASWINTWDTRISNELPGAVRITITVTDSKTIVNPPKEYSTIVYLPRSEVF